MERSASERAKSGADGILLEGGLVFNLEAGAAALFRSNFAPVPLKPQSLRHALLTLPSLFIVALVYLLK